AAVTARRYLAAAEAAGRGIVLLHDRVGHVGSRYALDVAEILVPTLEANGFVFAAPVLRFSSPLLRLPEGSAPGAGPMHDVSDASGEGDGDGGADLCARGPAGIGCAFSVESRAEPDGLPRTIFHRRRDSAAVSLSVDRAAPALADVDGDGASDLCVAGPH